MVTLSSSWAILLIIPWVLAGPVPPNSCASECRTPSTAKFRYEVGQTYTHSFQTSSKTWMMSTSDDQAVLVIKGQALVTFRAPCDAVLQLKQTSITGLDEKVDASELEKRPLLFSWQDGTVESVCSDEADPIWAVNIKRAILSMLQHTARFLDSTEYNVIESDVIGRCPTKYIVEGSAKSIVVTKIKVPNECSQRIGRHSSIPTVAYNVPAETQTIPVMNSTSVCKQQIKDGVVQSNECKESHLFRPLSTANGGARTDATSSISLVSKASAGAAMKMSPSSKLVSSSLVLDPKGIHSESQTARDVSAALRALCAQLAGDSPTRVPQHFTELVHALRKASHKEIKAAYANLKGKKMCPEAVKTEKLFLDALPQAGSTGAIAQMAEILKENKLSSRQALGWYLSMPLSKSVTIDAIKAIIPLIDTASDSPVALLGVTGLAHRYCAQNVEECQSSPDVKQLSVKLGKLLGNKCHADPKDEIRVLSALKALGNLGIMAPEVRNTVIECVKDARLPTTVRLAAIEASRHDPCVKQVKDNLLKVLEDKKEENEIRIAAYQGIMRCPCSPALLRIQEIMATEEHNQVGSYITSHIENLRSNPTPGKEDIRRLVKKMNFNRSYPSDLRKYSRNLAAANFCPVNNAGWDVDVDIIYASKSFIPRSASMNLTLDLFGQSVNLFEFGVRAENLEQILESFLTPESRPQQGSGILEKTGDAIGKFSEDIWNRLSSASSRTKRASIKPNELSTLDKAVGLKASGIKMDAFLRIFGSEVGIVNYRGAIGQPKLNILEGMQASIAEALRDLIEGAKRVNIDVARSLMFLDTAATFPTVAGFPLRLSVNGTTTVGLGLESQIDIPALIRDPQNADIRLKMSPLAVTELSAAMTIDIAVARTGIKMAATLHSSATADFSARFQQGSSVEVKLDMPKPKMTLVDFTSDILLIQQSSDGPERTKPLNVLNKATYNRGGCSERTTSVTGLRMCATSSLTIPRPTSDPSKDPTPAFPLSGTGSFKIVLEKTEPTMKGYLLSATLKQDGPKASSFVLMADTPGSKTNRKVTVKGTLTYSPVLAVKVDSRAPWGNLAIEGELVNRADLKSVQMKVLTHEKREYFGKTQISIAKDNRKYTYTSTVEAAWPGQSRAVILEGKFGHVVGSSVEISLKPSGPVSSWPLSVEGTFTRELSHNVQKISVSDFQLITPFGRTTLSTEIGRQDRTYLANFNMKYGAQHGKQHSVHFNGQLQSSQPQSDGSVAYKTVVVYKSSRFPDMNIDMKWDLKRSAFTIGNSLIVVHGRESEQSTNRLYINQHSLFKGEIAKRDKTVENKIEVTYPRFAINTKIDQTFRLDQKAVKAGFNVAMDNIRVVESDFSFVFAPKDVKIIYELVAKLAYPGRTISLVDTGKKIDANSFLISPVLDVQPGGKIELDGKASLIRDQNGISTNMDSELRISGMNSPIRLTHSFQLTGPMTMTTNNKVEWDGQTQLVLNAKLFQRTPTMPAVEMSLLWKNQFDGKVDFRLSRDDSKIDMDLNLLRLQRRVKIHSNHKVLGDSRSGAISVAWDADKDPSKQVALEGSLTVSMQQRIVDLKSTLNVENRVYTVAANGKLGAQFLNGDHAIRLEAQLPATKKALVSLALSNINQARKLANRLELETASLSGSTYQLTLSNTVNDLDRHTYAYTAITEISVKGSHLNEAKLRIDSKHGVKADKHNFDLKALVIAPKWGQNIDGSINVEVVKDAFRASSKYQRGPMLITVDSAGKVARQGHKISVEGFVEFKAPKLQLQQSKIAVVSSYDITDIFNFDISEKLRIEYQNTKAITLDAKVKASPSTIDATVMLETPYQAARRQGVTLSGRLEPGTRGEGSLAVIWSSPVQRQSQEARIDVEVEHRANQQLRFKVSTSSPIKGFESAELSFDGRKLDSGRTFEADLILGVSEQKAKLNSRLNLNPSQVDLDLTFSLPDHSPLRFVGRAGWKAPTYTVEIRVDWESDTFSVEGAAKYINSDNFDMRVVINSPVMGMNNFELKGQSKLHNKERTLEFTILNESTALVTVKSVFERKENRNGVEILGVAQVKVIEPEMSGSLKYAAETRYIDASDEKGIEHRLVVDMNVSDFPIIKYSGKLRLTNKEKSGLLGLCSKVSCDEASFGYKQMKGDTGKEAYVLMKSEGVVSGLRVKHSTTANKFEQSVEMLFDETKNQVLGYKAYKNDQLYGLDFITSKRVSGATFEIVTPTGRQSSKLQFVATIWTDKKKAPERKLVISTTVEPHTHEDMNGKLVSLAIKHPSLSQDLEYKLEYHAGFRSRSKHHLKLDVDVLDSKHRRFVLDCRADKGVDQNGISKTNVEAELRSQGTDLAAVLSLHAARTPDHSYSAGANLKLKEKDRILKDLFVRLNATENSAILSVGSPAKQMTLEGRWKVDQIVGHSRFQFTGSSRIFGLSPTVLNLDVNSSPHMDIKVFNKASPENSYQLAGGILDDARFELAVFRQLNIHKKDLAGVYVSLNRSDLLTSRLTWNVNDLQRASLAVTSRLYNVAEELKSVSDSLSADLDPIMLKWCSFGNLRPSFEKFTAEIMKRFKEMKTDYEQDESLRELKKVVVYVAQLAMRTTALIKEVAQNLIEDSDIVKSITDALRAVKQQVTKYASVIGQATSRVVGDVVHFFDTMERSYKKQGFKIFTESVREAYITAYTEMNFYFSRVIASVEDKINTFLVYYDTLKLRDQDIIASLRAAIADIKVDVLRQRIARFVDEAILTPSEEYLIRVTLAYPETTRFIYRYEITPIRKIRRYLEEVGRLVQQETPETDEKPKRIDTRRLLKNIIGEFVVYDIEKGEIQYQLPLICKIDSLRDLGKLFDCKSYPVKNLSIISSLKRAYHEMRAKYNPAASFTRLGGYASLIGSTGFITFDKTSYDLSGNCQYLLARDFLNMDFAVAVNFEDSTGKKSIIFTDGVEQVEIKNSQVLVNNKPDTVPTSLKSISVEREGDLISVKSSPGAVLRCDVGHDVCTLELSSLYAGRTMGLWGTLTNEQVDEMTEPNGKVSKDLATFAASWKLNKSCKDNIRIVADTAHSLENEAVSEVCRTLFEDDNSDLSACYGVISPAPYHDLCLKLASKTKGLKSTFHNQVKGLTTGYTRACSRHGVSL